MSKKPTFGVNVNNREPLIAPVYTLNDLLELSTLVDEVGFDSVWVGDSLFSKPRFEPMLLMAAISQITKRVKLGTSCLVTATRNPLYLALEWATLDHLTNGRTILGACMGSPEVGVRREYAALGLDFSKRAEIFEEGLAVLRELWTDGVTNFKGNHFQYDNVSFYSDTELKPLTTIQKPPPMWVVSNPRLVRGTNDEGTTNRVINKAAHRIAKFGDGWMTCCRAAEVDEFKAQREVVVQAIEENGGNPDDFTMSYQVTMNIADSKEEAQEGIQSYINEYYPELSQKMDISQWGPVGTPDDIMEWLNKFSDAGVDYFICRFGSLDQFGQVERFAKEIFPEFAPTK
jgi:alkanesulfonate monooxygenase SsuD/methylene tetrahydromethanopterin reductase-like flavin-dependent oxidoreductase (luciferase family)